VHRLLQQRSEELRKSFKRLASGQRIAEAADDPAGIAVAERMRAQLRSLSQASSNARAGIDLFRTADAALGETSNNLARMRELAVRSASETLSSEDRAILDQEFQALATELDAVAESTEFNGSGLLDGSLGPSLHLGPDADEVLEAPTVDASASGLGVDGLSIADASDAGDALAVIDQAVDTVGDVRGQYGGFISRLETHQRSTAIERENMAASEARISSLDVALESARLAAERLLSEGGVAALVHANVSSSRALALL
jgi:flagellin